ncbi:MAG: hypothetical protein ACI85O_000700 [Saprospiraceae bacterium]|jgi:hypothetical protein
MYKFLAVHGELEEETYSQFENRYEGFGENFYSLLKKKMANFFSKLIFYRAVVHQRDHSYAVYDNDGKLFAIQLDPYQVIIIWDGKQQCEFGDWDENAEENAIKCIEDKFL